VHWSTFSKMSFPVWFPIKVGHKINSRRFGRPVQSQNHFVTFVQLLWDARQDDSSCPWHYSARAPGCVGPSPSYLPPDLSLNFFGSQTEYSSCQGHGFSCTSVVVLGWKWRKSDASFGLFSQVPLSLFSSLPASFPTALWLTYGNYSLFY
jgi:hypothetical protein